MSFPGLHTINDYLGYGLTRSQADRAREIFSPHRTAFPMQREESMFSALKKTSKKWKKVSGREYARNAVGSFLCERAKTALSTPAVITEEDIRKICTYYISLLFQRMV